MRETKSADSHDGPAASGEGGATPPHERLEIATRLLRGWVWETDA